jgi:serine/threonine-protein kinase
MKTFSKYLVAAAVGFSSLATPLAASAADLYGAIAYSQQSAHYGWSNNMNSQDQAENAAMNQCYNYGSDCKSIWFSNACGSLAIGKDGGWGMNWGENKRQAENKAIAQCNNVSSGCNVEYTICTDNVR